MSAPYTRDTIAAIRVQAQRNVSARVIARTLGWDMAQLQRVARKHDIPLVAASGTSESPACKPMADGKLPALRTTDLDSLTWDVETRIVSFRDAEVRVTKEQMHILGILARRSHPLDPQTLCGLYGARRSWKTSISRLRTKLGAIGLSISSGHGLGYQLVVKAK
jgi:DNA-binding response OmpR family regulator